MSCGGGQSLCWCAGVELSDKIEENKKWQVLSEMPIMHNQDSDPKEKHIQIKEVTAGGLAIWVCFDSIICEILTFDSHYRVLFIY